MLGYLLTVICWLCCATVIVDCEPLSGPVVKIGRCRARCLDKLLNESVSGDECLTTPDCHMCWNFCDNLFTKYRLYGVVCNVDKVCTRGCEIACDFRHKPPGPSKNQRWAFSTGDVETRRNSRVTDIQWKRPKPPTSFKSKKSLVYIIMVRRKGSKDTWKQLKQVASHAVSFETDTMPDPPEFQLLAVSNRGIVARSKKLSPESFVKETYAFPNGHLEDGRSATYTPDISPMNITIDMKMVAGKLQTSLDWNHPSAEVLPCAKNDEPCFYEMNWFLTDCAAYPRAPSCETLPYHTAETTHFLYHEKPNFRIPDIELNSLYNVLISIRDAHGEAVEGKTSFKTPLCLKMSIDRTTCNDDLDVFGQNNPDNVPANLSLAVSTIYPETVSSTDIEELKLQINENPQMTFNPSTGMMEVNVTWTSVLNQSVFEKYQVFWYTDDDEYNPKPGQNETVQTHMILELETNRLYTIDVTAYYTDDYSEPCSITDAIQLLTQRNLSSSTVIAQPIKQPHKQDLSTLSGVIVGVVVATILIVVGFVVLFYKKRKSFKDIIITKTFVTKSNSYKSNVGAGKSNYSNQLMVISDEWELDPKQLKFSTQLGQGAFGKVVTGYYCDQKVAIKLIKEGAPLSYKEDLVAEINLMKRVGSHPNIVAMIGACTLNEPIALIMEFIPHGNLQNFMKKCRLEGDLRKRSDGASEIAYSMVDDSGGIENYFITPTDMLSFARQVAMAMLLQIMHSHDFKMASTISNICVNDYVKIDGKDKGRVISIVAPLGTYNMYNIRTYTGEMRQVSRYRLTKLPDTVTSVPVCGEIDLPTDLIDELMKDDFFTDEPDDCNDTDRSPNPEQLYDHSQIDKFVHDNQNRNTQRKTMYNMRRLQGFMIANGDTRPIESIQPTELCDILCTFFISLSKEDGSNYEPSTVRGMLSSFDRYLKSKHYRSSLINAREFEKLNTVIKTKQKVLKSEGMGNLPRRAESLTDDDINKLYETKQLGPHDPESILNTMWWNSTTHFGIRSVKPHTDMKWGDVALKTDTDGREFLEFTERQSKTCQGDNPLGIRNMHPKAWATNDERCPVSMYKLYSSLRPAGYSSPDTPFYIATNTKEPSSKFPWFKRQPVGINKLSSIMRRMSKNAGFENRNFTNHSARKFLVQKLSDENIPPTHIMQISGHRNMQSVNNYSQISSSQHRNISHILSGSVERRESRQAVSTKSSFPSTVNVTSAMSQSSTKVTFNDKLSSVFSAPVYGGTFNINFYGSASPPRAKKSKLSSDDDCIEIE